MTSGATTTITVSPDGAGADATSSSPQISADGSVIVFDSSASNLVSGGTSTSDVYRYDVAAGTTDLVSVGRGGLPADGASTGAVVSANGDIVAFSSAATNLVADDTNANIDAFVAADDGTISRRSNGIDGAEPDDVSFVSHLSGDGTTVGFESLADNLTDDDIETETETRNLFVAGPTGEAELVSIEPPGMQRPSSVNPIFLGLSDDGSLALFGNRVVPREPYPFGTVQAYLHDRQTDATELVSTNGIGSPQTLAQYPSMTGDGRYVLLDAFKVSFIDPSTNSYDLNLQFRLQTAQDIRITAITPSVVGKRTTTSVTITGSGFFDGAAISSTLKGSTTDGVSFANIVVVDRSTIVADVTVTTGAAPGPRLVTVETPHTIGIGTGVAAANLCRCLTVE